MTRIIISYRRDDSLDITGRIFDRLAGHFGREAIFRDIDNIPPGADFRRHIDQVLDESDIVLAIVGPRWIGSNDQQLRLASPADPVRLEVETALRKKKPLIPVLVSHAVMPDPDALPDVAPVGWPFRANGGHTARRAIGLRLVVMLGVIGAGRGWWVFVERPAEMRQEAAAAEKGRVEEQVRQAAAKTQVEDALKKGKADELDAKVYADAISLFRIAADQGNADAQVNMGSFYENGRGVTQDYVEAMRWYRRAADQGDRDGQVAVGLLYEYGRGVTLDYVEAMSWCRKAADQGDRNAQNLIGTLYSNGLGVPRDLQQAGQWFSKARGG
jgi:hypothetical protein